MLFSGDKQGRATGALCGITAKTFRPFGRVIEYPHLDKKGTTRNLWRIVHQADSFSGWRVAYLVLRDKTIGRMECHPESDETFEPRSGRALLFVSRERMLKDIQCFVLDRPVIIFKGIWHGVIRMDEEVHIKIFENGNVSCQYWPLGFRMDWGRFEQIK